MTVIDLETGDTIREATLNVTAGEVSAAGLTSNPGGWLVHIQTPRDNLLVDRAPAMDADYRIGIAPDGTWQFFMAGDFTDG